MRFGAMPGREASAGSGAKIEAAREELRRELGSEPSLADLAARVGSDEARLGRTIVRINTIESTSPLSAGDNSTAPRCRLRCALRTAVTGEGVRRARGPRPDPCRDSSLPPRERKVIGLYYYGEATMKQIGAEIGVNDSRVSQLHARAIQRLRKVWARTTRPWPAPAPSSRSTVPRHVSDGESAARPVVWRRAAVPSGPTLGQRRSPPSAPRRRRRCWVVGCGAARTLREHVARDSQQVFQSKRLGQPAAAGLFEEPLGVRARDVTRDEQHSTAHGGIEPPELPVQRTAIEPRHLEVADDEDRRRECLQLLERLEPSPARSTTKPASRSASATAAPSAASSSTTRYSGAAADVRGLHRLPHPGERRLQRARRPGARRRRSRPVRAPTSR